MSLLDIPTYSEVPYKILSYPVNQWRIPHKSDVWRPLLIRIHPKRRNQVDYVIDYLGECVFRARGIECMDPPIDQHNFYTHLFYFAHQKLCQAKLLEHDEELQGWEIFILQ